MAPDISVVIPHYNTPLALLYRAIQSAINQTYPPNEILICDDGSDTNAAKAILRHFGRQRGQPLIKVVTHLENRGISAARNSAASCASSDWLSWLDADDTLHADCLYQLRMASDNKKLVIGDCDLFVDAQYFRRRRVSNLEQSSRNHHKTENDPFLTQVTSLQPQLICKDTFAQLGGFSPEYRYAEVTEFFLRFLTTYGIGEVGFAPQAIYNYTYQKPDSWSRSREALFEHRRRALNTYRQAINLDGEIVYLHRDPISGFQMYERQCEGAKPWTGRFNSRASMARV